ncbi:GNAT family N-acetyltransferase [Salinisphaera aquimarina]|uniref:GNAT family N-acetyltransferase n=1 Tax=Salinisphaera aquimarina TaxID=2094031 RepID=A0ABV7EMV7_9GAMM
MGGLMSCFDDAVTVDSPENRQALLPAWEFLLAHAAVDAIELRAVHEQANIASLLDSVGGTPINADLAPFINMQTYPNFDAYLASRSKKMRQNQRRSAKYLGKEGELLGYGDDQQMSAETAIDISLDFKSRWLEARGLSGKTMLTNEARTFLKQVCRHYTRPSANACLSISSVYLDSKPVSVGIGFRHNGCHYEYLGSFDYRLEHFGPGRLRMEYGMRDCFKRGIATYSMLTPDTAFKKVWTEDAAVIRHYIVARSARGKLYRDIYMRKLRPRLKKMYHSLPPSLRTRIRSGHLWG